MRLSDFIEKTNEATDPADTTGLFKQAINDLGYEYYVYGALTNYGQYRFKANVPAPAIAVDYPADWVKHYFEAGYERIDPIVTHTPSMWRPFVWDDLRGLTRDESTVMSEAREGGLNHGICVPLRGPFGDTFGLSVAAGQRDVDPNVAMSWIHLLGAQFHTTYLEAVTESTVLGPAVPLTPRERECLLWSARGKSSWDISVILSISEHTVNFHIKNVMAKLNASNRVLAIVKAIRMGLILP